MRWTHWVNFPILAIMIWSGMLIYLANDVYRISFFGHVFVHFFPDWYYNLLHIPQRLAEGMAFHFLFMWFFALNGFFYLLYTIISGEWRQLLPNRHSFKEAWLVVLHDLHIRKTLPLQNKYNAAQRIAYTSIIIMGFGSLITGLAIYKPVQFNWLVWCAAVTIWPAYGICIDDWLCFVFSDTYHTGYPGRMEQFQIGRIRI